MLIYGLQGGVFVQQEFLDQPITLISLVIAVFVGGPLSEEFGWRGFALDRPVPLLEKEEEIRKENIPQ